MAFWPRDCFDRGHSINFGIGDVSPFHHYFPFVKASQGVSRCLQASQGILRRLKASKGVSRRLKVSYRVWKSLKEIYRDLLRFFHTYLVVKDFKRILNLVQNVVKSFWHLLISMIRMYFIYWHVHHLWRIFVNKIQNPFEVLDHEIMFMSTYILVSVNLWSLYESLLGYLWFLVSLRLFGALRVSNAFLLIMCTCSVNFIWMFCCHYVHIVMHLSRTYICAQMIKWINDEMAK